MRAVQTVQSHSDCCRAQGENCADFCKFVSAIIYWHSGVEHTLSEIVEDLLTGRASS